jgi:hypothetical protein
LKHESKAADGSLASNMRHSVVIITNVDKKVPRISRSHSAHPGRTQLEYPLSVSSHTQNMVYHQSANAYMNKTQSRSKYITEIYDKATNRFIPVRC